MRTPLHPTCDDLSLPTILYALGDPWRLKIVEQLTAAEDAISCGDLVGIDEVPKSTGSHHFKVLREAGLIRMVPQGRRMLVSVRKKDLEERFPGLLEAILHTYQRS